MGCGKEEQCSLRKEYVSYREYLQQGSFGLTSNGRPEEDEGHSEGSVLLLYLPAQHHKQQHV